MLKSLLPLLLLLAGPLLGLAQHRAAPIRAGAATTRPAAKARPPGGRPAAGVPPGAPAFTCYLHSPWVDSLMRVLTPDQRAAQLFMVAAYSNRTRADEDSISALIRQYGIGGLIFFQGGPGRQARLLNRYQSQSRVPLLVALDGEWGVGMRLDSVLKFPYQMSLGGTADTALLYDMGREVARQFRRLGMHVNFAPVVDVNNNAANPVIGFRSWGENPAAVARASRQYMRGMQDAGILAVAKHFPGHGDVDADSHLALPTVRVDRRRLDTLELPPFRSLMAGGLGGVMVAHLNVPALDSVPGPSTLSRPIITDLLRGEMGFKGLIFTDAMNMRGVISKFPPGEADVRALMAGNDILEFSKNVPLALRMVRAAVESGRLSQPEIDAHCRRVLALKQWAGLNRYQPIDPRHLIQDLNAPHARYLSHRLTELSITVLRNQRQLLPLQRLDTLRLATLVLGGAGADTTAFQRAVADYAPAAHFRAPATPTLDELTKLRAALQPYNVVLVALQGLGRLPATSFGITPETNLLLRELAEQQKLVISVFGSAYAVAKVRDLDRAAAVVLAYQESEDAQSLAVQAIFGGIGASGQLPVTVADRLPRGFGLATAGGLRLRYAHPEDVGLDGRLEARVDSVLGRALAAQAFPGAQVVVARRGTVVLRKSYGNQTYAGLGAPVGRPAGAPASPAPGTGRRQHRPAQASPTIPRPVCPDDLYDLGELTEVLATMPALLRLQARHRLSPDSTLGQYLPGLRGSSQAALALRDVLGQQEGAPPAPPLWQALARPSGQLRRRYFRPDSTARFPLPVAQDLWGRQDLPARLTRAAGVAATPGLPALLLPALVQQRAGQPLEVLLQREVYGPLGAATLGFRPTRCFPLRRLVPTEVDSVWRRQLLHGTVQDENAALLGGVSGRAGLFGDANDVAKLAQTYAWGGRYGGQQLFDPRLLAGWLGRAASPSAAPGRLAQTGFTGTYFEIEPQDELVVVLLTNRVHPTRRNNKLTALGVRAALLQVVREAVRK